jgi:hypothetical protein
MNRQPTEHDGRAALRDHLLVKADAARARHGPIIDDAGIMRLLNDHECVRYPTGVRFDASPLQPGEFAHAMPLGEHPRDGFCLFIHPVFKPLRDLWPLLIAYFIPPINYGDIAAPEDCELFGAALLGLDAEIYYGILCDAADLVSPSEHPIGSHS